MQLFQGKTVVLFGSGNMALECIAWLRSQHITVTAVVDNNPAKWQQQIDGIDILPPATLTEWPEQQLLIVVASSFYAEIKPQLQSLLLREYQHFLSFADAVRYVRAAEASQHRPEITTAPLAVFNIELTNQCPMKCVMCARTEGMTRRQGLMDLALYTAVIDQLAADNPQFYRDNQLWLHHFGESLLHPQFDTFIQLAAKRDLQPALSLNPLLLTEDVTERLLQAQPHLLYISLDGHDNESFFRIRGVRNAYDKSHQLLLAFLRRKVQLNSKVKVVLSMINFAENTESIEKMQQYWQQIPGIDQFMAKGFVSWNGDIQSINQYEQPQGLPYRHFVSCQIPWRTMTITWDGDVVPCCYDYDKKYVLGNAASQSLREIWNGAPMQQLRREFNANQVQNPLCRNCTSLHQISEV